MSSYAVSASSYRLTFYLFIYLYMAWTWTSVLYLSNCDIIFQTMQSLCIQDFMKNILSVSLKNQNRRMLKYSIFMRVFCI